MWLTAKGSFEGLENFVADPAKFRVSWRKTSLTFTDQIPVWLKVGVTKNKIKILFLIFLKKSKKTKRKHVSRWRQTNKPAQPRSDADSGKSRLRGVTPAKQQSRVRSLTGRQQPSQPPVRPI